MWPVAGVEKYVLSKAPEYIAAPAPLPPILNGDPAEATNAVLACKMDPKLVPSLLLVAITCPVVPSTTGASSMVPPAPPTCMLVASRHGWGVHVPAALPTSLIKLRRPVLSPTKIFPDTLS